MANGVWRDVLSLARCERVGKAGALWLDCRVLLTKMQPENYCAGVALTGADALGADAARCFLAARSAFFLAAAACILACCFSLGRLKYTPAITTAIAVL